MTTLKSKKNSFSQHVRKKLQHIVHQSTLNEPTILNARKHRFRHEEMIGSTNPVSHNSRDVIEGVVSKTPTDIARKKVSRNIFKSVTQEPYPAQKPSSSKNMSVRKMGAGLGI